MWNVAPVQFFTFHFPLTLHVLTYHRFASVLAYRIHEISLRPELTQMNTSDDIVEGYKGKANLRAVEGENRDWEGPITDLEEWDGSSWNASTRTDATLYVTDYLVIDKISFYIDLDTDARIISRPGKKD
jgi:hypothetical protein